MKKKMPLNYDYNVHYDVWHFLSCNFFFDKKVTKKSRKNEAIPPSGLPTPAVLSGLRSF